MSLTPRQIKTDERLIPSFINSHCENRDLSENTRRNYTICLETFVEFVHKKRAKTLERLNKDDWLAFASWARSQYSASTLVPLFTATRLFCEFLADKQEGAGLIETTPVGRSFRVSRRKYEPCRRCPTLDQFLQLRALLLQLEAQRQGRRKSMAHMVPLEIHLAAEMIATGGFRINELCQLTFEMVIEPNFDKHGILPGEVILNRDRIHIKREKSRVTNISPYALSLLRRVRGSRPSTDTIFPWTDVSIRRNFEAAGKLVGIAKLHPHDLRRFFANLMLWRNYRGEQFNLLWLSRAMGHDGLLTTNIYTVEGINAFVGSDNRWAEVVLGDTSKLPYLYEHWKKLQEFRRIQAST